MPLLTNTTLSVFSSTKWSQSRGECMSGREGASNFKICRDEVMSAADLLVPLQRSLEGTGDSSHMIQLKTKVGSKNIIIPKLSSQEKQNPSHEIESFQSTVNHLQSQMKCLQPGDGSFNITDFRWRLNKVEKEKLELTSKFNEERSAFESHVARLRAQLEKGEAMRQTLEYDLAVSKKEASVVRSTSEDRIEAVHKMHAQLKVQNSELQQKVENLEKTLHILQQAREDDQQRFQSEQDDREKIIQNTNSENEFLIAERNRIDTILQDQEETFVELQKRLKELETERNSLTEALRRQAKELEYSIDREERLKKELEASQQRVKTTEVNIEAERAAHLESKFNSEIIQEKLTFLHNLYQRLTAGCVVMKQPDNMLSKFSWQELCSILQENVDALLSDLFKANEKVSYLERTCQNKEETIQQLQQSQETTFSKLTEQMKEREASWQKQKNQMEQHYSGLLGEVHSRAQSCHLGAEEAKENASSLAKVNNQLTLELSLTKKLLSQKQKEHVALLAACALMAGALYPLYSRSCELSVQKDFLKEQVSTCDYFKNEIRTVVQVLSLEGNPDKSQKRKKPQRGLIQVFRKIVIAILAANRLQAFGLGRRPLFTWSEGIKNKPKLAVFSGNTKSCVTSSRREQEQDHFTMAVGWFSSSDLLSVIVDCMSELQDAITKAHLNHHYSNWSMENVAKSSFSKFMEKLSVEMENIPPRCDKHIGCGHKNSLVQILGCGLCKATTKSGKEGCQVTMPIKKCMEILKKQILEFTQRLHAAEVERRSLRLELTQLKNYTSDLKKEAAKAQNLEQQLSELKHSLKTQKMVPFERFGSICEELNNALHREQQAQLLLNEQTQQMQKLNLNLEKHSNKEVEKNQMLSEAVMSLSEAKMELKRKDQSLRQLNKNLAQLEQDKRQLEESIHDAENALCKAAKDRENLVRYLRSLNVTFQQVRDQILLSWSVTARNDFTLHLPKLQLESMVVKGPKDGLEVTSLQNLTQTFTDIYQLASSRVTALESEITSHQKHIGALKSELQTACLRENDALVPIIRTPLDQSFTSHSEMVLPQEKNISQDFAPLQPEMDTSSYSILRERSGISRPHSHSAMYSLHVSSTSGSLKPVQNGFCSTFR
ncbi:coiled-coil domain-containing protein 171 isoform X6 [Narcine bancroftii]|uniref:coiled-coil domain-containing protein 171 isoform X6 n=1 Tax=Narcine bancroftii TaxID=1343680 RepID=UPI0038320A0C